jgi:alpha-beta hydrolase superfamily lysophospholipase
VRSLAFALLALAAPALAQDYEREARWAAEVRGNLVVGEAVALKLPGGKEFLGLYAEAKPAKGGVILVHGLGVHPDHGVIGTLRVWLADAGYATLSIQMPVLAADAGADRYPPLFAEAVERMDAGAHWLKGRGHARVVLLTHSMGSRMADHGWSRSAPGPYSAWISLGLGGPFGSLAGAKIPILDVYGEADSRAVIDSASKRVEQLVRLGNARQAMITKANHHYTGREKELAAVIIRFLGEMK